MGAWPSWRIHAGIFTTESTEEISGRDRLREVFVKRAPPPIHQVGFFATFFISVLSVISVVNIQLGRWTRPGSAREGRAR